MERYVGSTVPEPLAFRIVGGGSPARSTAALLLGVALRFVRGCASARCRASRAVLTPKGHVYWGFRRALVSQPRTPVLSVLPQQILNTGVMLAQQGSPLEDCDSTHNSGL